MENAITNMSTGEILKEYYNIIGNNTFDYVLEHSPNYESLLMLLYKSELEKRNILI